MWFYLNDKIWEAVYKFIECTRTPQEQRDSLVKWQSSLQLNGDIYLLEDLKTSNSLLGKTSEHLLRTLLLWTKSGAKHLEYNVAACSNDNIYTK